MMLTTIVMAAFVYVAQPQLVSRSARYDREIVAAVAAVSEIYPVPPALVKAVIHRESYFDPTARSKVGAIGLMQVMPFNAERLGFTVADLRDPQKNILAGTRLLAVLLRHYQGDVISTLVAYNARPRKRFAPIPKNGETPEYVRAVLRNLLQYRSG